LVGSCILLLELFHGAELLVIVLSIGIVFVGVEEGTQVNAFFAIAFVHKVLEIGKFLSNDVSDDFFGRDDVAHVRFLLRASTTDTDMEMGSGLEDGGIDVSLGKNVLNDVLGILNIVSVSSHVFALYLQNVQILVGERVVLVEQLRNEVPIEVSNRSKSTSSFMIGQMSGSIGKRRVVLELLPFFNGCPVSELSGCIVGVEALAVSLGVFSEICDFIEEGVY